MLSQDRIDKLTNALTKSKLRKFSKDKLFAIRSRLEGIVNKSNNNFDSIFCIIDLLIDKKQIKISEFYFVKAIENKIALELVVKNHYLHRKAPCSYPFGLFEIDTDKLVGVIMYGSPASRTLQGAICGNDLASEVVELTRVWIEDGTPNNVESFLIGKSLKLIPKKIIVSFAEVEQGHLGIIYQATNWLYTGLSAKRADWRIRGQEGKHHQTMSDEFRGEKNRTALMKEKYGDAMYMYERPRKHRYVFINAKGRERERLMAKMRYGLFPYPKQDDNFPNTKVVNKAMD